MNITSTLLFFVEKNVRIFIAKDTHILSTKNNSVFAYKASEVLNSWPQVNIKKRWLISA